MVICEHVQALTLCKAWRYFDSSEIHYGCNREMCPVEIISIKSVFILKFPFQISFHVERFCLVLRDQLRHSSPPAGAQV